MNPIFLNQRQQKRREEETPIKGFEPKIKDIVTERSSPRSFKHTSVSSAYRTENEKKKLARCIEFNSAVNQSIAESINLLLFFFLNINKGCACIKNSYRRPIVNIYFFVNLFYCAPKKSIFIIFHFISFILNDYRVTSLENIRQNKSGTK